MGGTFRSELFIHSEATAAQGQACPPGTRGHCFDDPDTAADDDPYESDIGNYESNGCIKVSHKAMALVDHAWHEHGGATYWAADTSRIVLVVNDWPGYNGG